jgi:hypothetical protein
MPTWVLVITLIANSHPIMITSVPGYLSPGACRDAGQQYLSLEQFDGVNVKFACISGPQK